MIGRLLRNIWWALPVNRGRARVARAGPAALISCTHNYYRTPCQLRLRPGDTRKSCWEVCHNCGKWLACSNC